MINNLDEFTTASVIRLIDSIESGCGQSFKALIPMMNSHEIDRNETLFQAGQENRYVCIVQVTGVICIDVGWMTEPNYWPSKTNIQGMVNRT